MPGPSHVATDEYASGWACCIQTARTTHVSTWTASCPTCHNSQVNSRVPALSSIIPAYSPQRVPSSDFPGMVYSSQETRVDTAQRWSVRAFASPSTQVRWLEPSRLKRFRLEILPPPS